MNTIDLIILIVLILGGLNGLRQGFIRAFMNLLGWIFALIIAAKYAVVIAPMMYGLSQDPVVQKIAAFALIVLLIVVLTWLVGAMLNSLLKSLKLGPLNRLAGSAFGAFKSLFVVLVIMHFVGPWVESSPTWKQSKFVDYLSPYAPIVSQISKDATHEAIQHMQSDPKPVAKANDSSEKSSIDRSDHSTDNPFY